METRKRSSSKSKCKSVKSFESPRKRTRSNSSNSSNGETAKDAIRTRSRSNSRSGSDVNSIIRCRSNSGNISLEDTTKNARRSNRSNRSKNEADIANNRNKSKNDEKSRTRSKSINNDEIDKKIVHNRRRSNSCIKSDVHSNSSKGETEKKVTTRSRSNSRNKTEVGVMNTRRRSTAPENNVNTAEISLETVFPITDVEGQKHDDDSADNGREADIHKGKTLSRKDEKMIQKEIKDGFIGENGANEEDVAKNVAKDAGGDVIRLVQKGSERKRKRPEKKITDQSRDYGPEKDRTCPLCKKVFSIVTGLAYHIEHKVCQKTTSFPLLTPGDKFISKYGIVQILSDDRVQQDIEVIAEGSNTKVGISAKVRKRKLANAAVAQVQRKDRLVRLNNRIISERSDGKVVDDERDRKLAADIWAEYSTSIIPTDILAKTETEPVPPNVEQKIEKVKISPAEDEIGTASSSNTKGNSCDIDPIVSKGSYPDRIVECVLINDTRKKVSTLEVEKEGEERISKVVVAEAIVKATLEKEEGKAKNGQGNGKEFIDDEQHRNIVVENCCQQTYLFLRRKDLNKVYNPNLPLYICTTCGSTFSSRVGFKNHIDENICKNRGERILTERRNRLKKLTVAINKAEANRLTMLQKKTSQEKKPSQEKKTSQEKKKSKKKGKKKEDFSWIIFNPDSCPVYPEVYAHMEFRRAGNNAQYTKKKCSVKKPYKRISRAGKNLGPDGPGDAVYPQIWAYLFLHIPVAERRIDFFDRPVYRRITPVRKKPSPKLDVEKSMIEDTPSDINLDTDLASETPLPLSSTEDSRRSQKERTVQETDSAEVLTVKKKKKRRKGSPLIDPTAIVDLQIIVKEIRSGRYPSMSPYMGDHLTTCFICNKDKGNLLFCEYCNKCEHLECLKTKWNVKSHETGDEFMCHMCVQNMLIRRARNARRREREKEEREHFMIENGVTRASNDGLASAADVANAAKAAIAIKREVVWNQSDFDCQRLSYRKCPFGGPGGLICCRPCSSAYSRFLANTTMEMESQSVSSVGREVGDLMRLLLDAQVKLQQSVDVTNCNELRRSLLDKDEVDNYDNSGMNKSTQNDQVFGIMDIFD